MGHRSASYGGAGAGIVGRVGPFGKPGGSPHSHGVWEGNPDHSGYSGARCGSAAAQWAHTRRVGVAGGKWRCADRLVCPAAGGCRRDRCSSGPRNIFGLADFGVAITLEFITSPGPLRLVVPNVPSIGASACPADPGLRGAKLDPAARPVAAPADPTRGRLISFLSFDLDADNSRMEGWSNVR